MGIWGGYSKKDEAYYAAQARRDRQRENNRRKIEDWMPFREETLARVKAGEISLEEAQRLIAKKESRRP